MMDFTVFLLLPSLFLDQSASFCVENNVMLVFILGNFFHQCFFEVFILEGMV